VNQWIRIDAGVHFHSVNSYLCSRSVPVCYPDQWVIAAQCNHGYISMLQLKYNQISVREYSGLLELLLEYRTESSMRVTQCE